ncbi:MAG: hypothetical protein ACHQC9_02105 [Alphaproteobacteria bacterium]
MSVKIRRDRGARQEGNDKFPCAPAPSDPGAVERLLASAYQAGSAGGDLARDGDEGGRCAAGVVVTRRTDESGNPIGYLLMSSEPA